MNKKILIGSIIAVVILILVSFTSVVGFHSVKSNSAINSPLFSIRTRRAIGQGQQDITTDYLGHGKENNLHLTGRIQRAEQVQKVIDIINKMDDKALSRFIARIINQEQMNGKEILDVIQAFQHIKRNPNYMKNIPFPTLEYITCHGFPGCIIKFIYTHLTFIVIAVIGWITSHTCFMACNTLGCPL